MDRISILFIAVGLFVMSLNPSRAQTTDPINVSFEAVLSHPVDNSAQKIAYGEDDLQYGLLWLPDSNPSPPLVVVIHGGCWLNSFDVNHSAALSSALASAGFAVWSLEYRRTGDPGGGWPGTLNDIELALSKLSSLEELGVDTTRYAIAGHSAGGHLALLAGSKFANARVVIGLAAIANIESYAQGNNSCQTATSAFMGSTLNSAPDLYALANPAKQSLHPHTLLFHGNRDTIVPLAQSQSLDFPLRIAEGAGHFDWIHPETSAFGMFLESLQSNLSQ